MEIRKVIIACMWGMIIYTTLFLITHAAMLGINEIVMLINVGGGG
jgi:hypothetical protein